MRSAKLYFTPDPDLRFINNAKVRECVDAVNSIYIRLDSEQHRRIVENAYMNSRTFCDFRDAVRQAAYECGLSINSAWSVMHRFEQAVRAELVFRGHNVR